MVLTSIKRTALLAILPLMTALVIFSGTQRANAEPYVQGPTFCEECHKEEAKVWATTKHFETYRTVHKSKDAKKIVKAVGGKKNMKRNKNCSVCHYSKEQKKPTGKSKIKYGPSCEDCHGASSEWETVHADYGGKNVKREDETPAHKAKRIADSTAAGLIWANMTYDIAVNCMKCHGLARSEISGKAFGKMLKAGHPINQSFEIVMFSQGKMRHWLKPRSPAQLAKLFVAGQAAKLVSATEMTGKSKNKKYKAAQMQRVADAKAALQGVPGAAALIKAPSNAAARAMMKAIGDQDISGLVGGRIPCAAPDKENLRQC
ncbi:MAG: multiheme c-type cytochrome [Alphaproteobacteria bacterium]|nr:multiheme c-type cytochrome [Alphaproteobacteria bacterium]